MVVSYIVCDHCGGDVDYGTGAVVSRHTDDTGAYPEMHLCSDCCDKLLTSQKKPQEITEGGKA